MRYIGGGHKPPMREIDLKRDKYGMPATVKHHRARPNRSARIALLVYADGEKRYILAPNGPQGGPGLLSGRKDVAPRWATPPLSGPARYGGAQHRTAPRQGWRHRTQRGHLRPAERPRRHATLKMPSGELRMVLTSRMATVGTVGNAQQCCSAAESGPQPLAGRRPRTRPVAMNPVDHPMGGGEGRIPRRSPAFPQGASPRVRRPAGRRTRATKLIILSASSGKKRA